MTSIKKLVPFSLVLAAALPAGAQHLYNIDPAHSSAQFTVTHMMISKVKGEFGKVSGTVFYDPAKPEADRLDVTIDVNALTTREEKRDGHLKSPDFFDVAKYPTMTFKSTSAYKEGGKLMVKGDLTIHGVTKPVVLEVTDGPSPEIQDHGMQKLGASASTKLNRKDFGLVWSKTIDGGGAVVGDEVDVNLDVEMSRKP
jgi:polyisoprenoid-binding protein YceI